MLLARYTPIAFMSRATSSIAAIPELPIFVINSVSSANCEPSPHKPSLRAYARFSTFVAPVAEAYTTRAFFISLWNLSPAIAVSEAFALPKPFCEGFKLAILCDSSNTITPSKSFPSQRSITSRCFTFSDPPDFDAPLSVSYVTNKTPSFVDDSFFFTASLE